MFKPPVFKYENVSSRDASTNLNFAREVIRRDFGKWKDHRIGEHVGPGNRGEKPINLFKKRGVLHITSSIASPFDGQFNQAQMADDTIED